MEVLMLIMIMGSLESVLGAMRESNTQGLLRGTSFVVLLGLFYAFFNRTFQISESTRKLINLIVIVIIGIILLFVYLKERSKSKMINNSNIITYDVEENLSYEEKLSIFRATLPSNVICKWEQVKYNIKFLKDKDFHSKQYDEIDKMLYDLAVKSVINGKASIISVEEFENTLKEYGEYIKMQMDQYYAYEKRELEETQSYINAEHMKVRSVLTLMKDEPLHYK